VFDNILVLCVGNICRSPVAEAFLKAELPGKSVRSAGLGALVGHPADPTAQTLASAEGLDLADHRAQQVTPAMLGEADLILVMSRDQRGQVRKLHPTSGGKTMLLTHWLPGQPDIPDPYKKSAEAFEHVHKQIVSAAKAWLPKLS
jgi:protein-tyrosine phosphatase